LKIALVLTATIKPSEATPNLMLRDPELRLREYSKSINWWSRLASKNDFDLFVFENSGSAQEISHLESQRVSVISVPSQDNASVRKGKGSGESAILRIAAETVSEYTLALKCTGRLQVLNAADLVERHLSVPEVETIIPWEATFRKVDTRCFTVRPAFLHKWMSEIESQVTDAIGCDLESQSAHWLLSQIHQGKQVADCSRTPAIIGKSGSVGVVYSRRKAVTRMYLEQLVRGRIRTDSR